MAVSYVVLTNDPHPPSDGCRKGVDQFAVLSASACILPGVVGAAVVGAGALVRQDVKAGRVVAETRRDVGPTSPSCCVTDGEGRLTHGGAIFIGATRMTSSNRGAGVS